MGQHYTTLKSKDIAFIKRQKIFFVASSSGQEVNLSPKGYESLAILDAQTLLYMDFAGSGNRSYRDATAGGAFTLMFNAFEGEANITKVFAKAEVVGKADTRFVEYMQHFQTSPTEIRQLFSFSYLCCRDKLWNGCTIYGVSKRTKVTEKMVKEYGRRRKTRRLYRSTSSTS
ncbi:MAG: hypothetical protein Q9M36_06190 [Sulfurovum sp.]|nr:hypothetical protein [Sulfurovum sp.]